MKWVIPEVSAAIGVVASITTGGLVTSILNSWVIPAASAGLAIGGGATGIILLTKVVKGAKKSQYGRFLFWQLFQDLSLTHARNCTRLTTK